MNIVDVVDIVLETLAALAALATILGFVLDEWRHWRNNCKRDGSWKKNSREHSRLSQ